ncbi:MAG: lysophospholipid acyltransferase family protein [Opitutales bacterium]
MAAKNPFDTRALISQPLLRVLYRPLQGIVERRLGIQALNRIYAAAGGDSEPVGPFCRQALQHLRTRWSLDQEDEACLAGVKGPLVIVANHPYGCVDSLCLMNLMERMRPGGWKILSNAILRDVRPLQEFRIEVDGLGLGREAQSLNRQALKQALAYLGKGGCLALFPARRVAHFDDSLGAVVDQPWSSHALKLAVSTGATLACLHIPGENSPEFTRFPLHKVRRRTLRLCREVVDAPPRKLPLSLALLLPPKEVRSWADPSPARGTARLHAHCFIEADRRSLAPGCAAAGANPESRPSPVENPDAADLLAELHPAQRLYRKGDLELLFIRGLEAPGLLECLGRAREVTFRATGQGVGKDIDLSPEDNYYHQLIVWDHRRGTIAGAYRVGILEAILGEQGSAGLYLDHVFRIDPAFYKRFPASLELSRSFVLPDYQRDNRVLPLLWFGLAQICRQRQIRTLFGSVTISNQFHPASRAILVDFLRQEYADSPEVCDWIVARCPFRPQSRYHRLVTEAYRGETIGRLDPLIRHLENGQRGIPPLMRYYCRLGARFMSYHVEASFQDALYCLLRVDLSTITPAYQRRFSLSE